MSEQVLGAFGVMEVLLVPTQHETLQLQGRGEHFVPVVFKLICFGNVLLYLMFIFQLFFY